MISSNKYTKNLRFTKEESNIYKLVDLISSIQKKYLL